MPSEADAAEALRAERLSEGSAGPDAPPDAAGIVMSERESQPGHVPGEEGDDDHDISPVAPTQLGARRFVYAAYFAGGIGIAFILSKALDFAWLKLQIYKPSIGEPRDEIVMPLAALLGGGAAVYYWFRTRARQLAEEVAAEMSKVTWPSRTEVTNGTVVVIVTTVVSTVFFALMDKFWGFITNLVYGGT